MTVSSGLSWARSWSNMASWTRAPISTEPTCGTRSPASRRSSVVLPEPLGPMTPMRSPRRIVAEKSRRTGVSAPG